MEMEVYNVYWIKSWDTGHEQIDRLDDDWKLAKVFRIFFLCCWLFSVSKSKLMTQICTCKVKREVLFWNLCWDVLFFTSVACAGTKKITHTSVLTSFSLQLSLCNYPSQIRVILLKPDLYWFRNALLCKVSFFVRNEEENMNLFSSLMFGF